MSIFIRTEFELTHKGSYLVSRLGLNVKDFASKMLFISEYPGCQLCKFGNSNSEFYWTLSHPDSKPLEPLAYVEDLLKRRKTLLLTHEFGELFKLKRCIIDIFIDKDNEARFDYRMNAIGEWVAQ